MIKLFCAMPTRGKVHVLAREAFSAAADSVAELGGDFHGECVIAWHVVHARNEIVRRFLKSDFTHLMMVDDDVVIPPNAGTKMFDVMMNHDAGMVSACVPFIYKNELLVSVCVGTQGYLRPWPRGSFPIDQCGGACVLIRRDVIEKIQFPWFTWHEDREHGAQLGEDVEFSRSVRQAGFTIAACDVRCRHLVDGIDLHAFADRVDQGETRSVSRLGVIGCPRSGTMFFAEFCRSRGLDVGHEKINVDGGVGWWFAASHPFSPEQSIGIGMRRFSRMIHLVRDPIKTISSFVHLLDNSHREWLDYMQLFVCVGKTGHGIAFAAEIWCAWQRLCLSRDCDCIIKVEEPEALDLAMRLWGWTDQAETAAAPRSTNINATPNKRELSAIELVDACDPWLISDVLEVAGRLGYPMQELAECDNTSPTGDCCSDA